MLRCYLSGSMAKTTKSEMTDWRNHIKTTWPQFRYHDPVRRLWDEDEPEYDKLLVELDKFDISSSDILLAYVFKYSAGTMMEIMYAHSLGKMVLVVNKLGHPISPWVRYHSTKVFADIKDAMDFVERQLDIDRQFDKPQAAENRVAVKDMKLTKHVKAQALMEDLIKKNPKAWDDSKKSLNFWFFTSSVQDRFLELSRSEIMDILGDVLEAEKLNTSQHKKIL